MSTAIARAADIMNTMSTPGWRLILAEAERAVEAAEESCLRCGDDAQVLRLQHKAVAAREFYEDWLRRVDAAGSPPEEEFQPVAY